MAKARRVKKVFYAAGRAFQLAALVAMPSAVWVGQFDHNEKGAIAIFLSSLLIFWVGYLLTQSSSRL